MLGGPPTLDNEDYIRVLGSSYIPLIPLFQGGGSSKVMWEFAKIWGTLLGVPIIRIIICWGL